MVFFQEYEKIREEATRRYKINNEENLNLQNFKKINWKKPETRNFCVVIKILAENGPASIGKIMKLDPFSKNMKYVNRYRGIYSILEGRKKDGEKDVKGLIDKKLVKKVVKHGENTYHLTLFGIFLAIDLFVDSFAVSSGLLGIDSKKESAKNSLNLLENIVKNYSNSLPLIFERWDNLKKIGLVPSILWNILHPNTKLQMYGLQSLNLLHSYAVLFNTYEKQITAEFYYNFLIENFYQINEKKIKKQLGSDILILLKTLIKVISNKTLIDHLDIESKKALFENKKNKKESINKQIKKLQLNTLQLKI